MSTLGLDPNKALHYTEPTFSKECLGTFTARSEVFLDVPKAFDTLWVNGLLYKLTFRKFPSYLVRSISFSLHGRTFEASFETAATTSR